MNVNAASSATMSEVVAENHVNRLHLVAIQQLAQIGGRRDPSPLISKGNNVAPVPLRQFDPALAEIAGRDHSNGIAGAAQVDDRALHGPRSRASEKQHGIL